MGGLEKIRRSRESQTTRSLGCWRLTVKTPQGGREGRRKRGLGVCVYVCMGGWVDGWMGG